MEIISIIVLLFGILVFELLAHRELLLKYRSGVLSKSRTALFLFCSGFLIAWYVSEFREFLLASYGIEGTLNTCIVSGILISSLIAVAAIFLVFNGIYNIKRFYKPYRSLNDWI